MTSDNVIQEVLFVCLLFMSEFKMTKPQMHFDSSMVDSGRFDSSLMQDNEEQTTFTNSKQDFAPNSDIEQMGLYKQHKNSGVAGFAESDAKSTDNFSPKGECT